MFKLFERLKIGRTMSALLMATSRDGENIGHLRLLACECIGAFKLGALDPDGLELGERGTKMVVINNFTDDAESKTKKQNGTKKRYNAWLEHTLRVKRVNINADWTGLEYSNCHAESMPA
ncbi:hypothetical protein BC629DRAFT_1442236 [Irpex lacteus]|nr:hypothetical protein BC629DRAFT_1442236 [Irpex lacteus]